MMNYQLTCDYCGKQDSEESPIMCSTTYADVSLCEKCDYIERNEHARIEIEKQAAKEGITVSEWHWILEQKLRELQS